MKSTFEVSVGNRKLEVNLGTYPGGEVSVSIPSYNDIFDATEILVVARLRCANGIQALFQIKSILEHYECYGNKCTTKLYLGYVPYSRQDRVCSEGEALAIKVFANQINSMGFTDVLTVDNHSDVTTSLLDNVGCTTKEEIFEKHPYVLEGFDVLVAPDFGAAKEVQELARLHNKMFVQGYKTRNPSTGELSGFGHYADADLLHGKKVLIVDDLCDGGGTFLGLAKNLSDRHCIDNLSLYVTHGIFSKGTKLLTDSFDGVYTTDTLVEDAPEGVTVFKLS